MVYKKRNGKERDVSRASINNSCPYIFAYQCENTVGKILRHGITFKMLIVIALYVH